MVETGIYRMTYTTSKGEIKTYLRAQVHHGKRSILVGYSVPDTPENVVKLRVKRNELKDKLKINGAICEQKKKQ